MRRPPVPYSSVDRTAIFFIAALLVRVIQAQGFRVYETMKRELADPRVSNWDLARRYGFSLFQVRILRRRVDLVLHLEATPLSPVQQVAAKIRKATARSTVERERRRA